MLRRGGGGGLEKHGVLKGVFHYFFLRELSYTVSGCSQCRCLWYGGGKHEKHGVLKVVFQYFFSLGLTYTVIPGNHTVGVYGIGGRGSLSYSVG